MPGSNNSGAPIALVLNFAADNAAVVAPNLAQVSEVLPEINETTK